MKTVILAGGFGQRISAENPEIPKPLLQIGNRPIIWHIMKYYSGFGFNEFIICLGYKGHLIKQFFTNYYLDNADIHLDFRKQNQPITIRDKAEPWQITLVDTGLNTQTGGRLARVKDYLQDQTFMLTYSDGLSNINLDKLIDFHYQQQKTITISAIRPASNFGILEIDHKSQIRSFAEKPPTSWINGGFMVMEAAIFDYLKGDDCPLEAAPLQNLALAGQACAYQHHGFWQCMDNPKDKSLLSKLWLTKQAPWQIW